jgi:hypothetical protein
MALLAVSAQMAFAQQPASPHPQHGHPGGRMSMSAMALQHQRMMDSLNARLDSLVTRMNQATGDRKIAAMADVINELVAQRRGMSQQMRRMLRPRAGAGTDTVTSP